MTEALYHIHKSPMDKRFIERFLLVVDANFNFIKESGMFFLQSSWSKQIAAENNFPVGKDPPKNLLTIWVQFYRETVMVCSLSHLLFFITRL